MDVIEITSGMELLAYLRLSNPRWKWAQFIDHDKTWIFRGQGDARWGLVPKSLRSAPVPRSGADIPLPWYAASVEFDRLQSFIKIADDIGALSYPVPKFPSFYAQIKRAAKDPDAPAPDYTNELLEAFALAQHHGVDTRLLDWSASPLTAAFFAAQDAFESDDDRTSFAIWAMPRERPGDKRIKVITPSRTSNRFAHRQTGYLSLDLEGDRYYQEGRGWPSHDEVLDEYQRGWGDGKWPCLRKIVVPKSCAGGLILDLYREGVSLAHLMPTLDNAVRTMDLINRLTPLHIDRVLELHSSISQGREKPF